MKRIPGKFVWFEHVSNDIERARAFYGELVGWRSDPARAGSEPYAMIVNGAEPIGGFCNGVPGHWRSYLSVEDVDAAAKRATVAGAKLLMAPQTFGEVGRGAELADPGGASLCIWTGSGNDRPDREHVPAGDWYWNECMTTDPAKSLAFYEGVFGFTHEVMNVGRGDYYVLKQGEVARAGLMASPQAGIASFWLPYLSVCDCDVTASKAAALGARIALPPLDIPNVGRIAAVVDPLGATIGLIRGRLTIAT
jgi:predicted enzyme related to lactoylglutathione lyase